MTIIARAIAGAIVAACVLSPTLAPAEGNLAADGEDLVLNINTIDLTFSQTEWQLETGQYYRIDITSDGNEEVAVAAPELWRNSWINQVVVNDLEVTPYGLHSVEFDAEGTFTIGFVPIRPGEYEIYVPGYEDRGLRGKFIVK